MHDMKNKHILQVLDALNVGGLETVAMNFVRFTNYHYDFVVFSDAIGAYEEEARNLGCRIYHITSFKQNYFKFRNEFSSILKNNHYDAVHSHVFFSSGIVLQVAKQSGAFYCVAHVHSIKRADANQWSKQLKYFLMKQLLLRYADCFCACSKQAGNYVFGKKPFSQRGMVIPNTINLSAFAYSDAQRQAIRNELTVDETQLIIGTVGHLSESKNQEFLIRAFSKLVQQGHDIHLVVVGDGTIKEKLENLARELGVTKHINFTGEQRNVASYLSAMDVFVLPSKHEGFGIVLLEAKANGLPCLVESHAVVNEIKELGCSCCDGFDTEEWSKKILELMNKGRAHTTQRNVLEQYDNMSLQNYISRAYARQDGRGIHE